MDEPVAKYFPKFADMRVAVTDPKRERGPIRWKYRQMINALVYQAIVD